MLINPTRKTRNRQRKKPSRFTALRGTRKTGITTDEIMVLLRGYDTDKRDPGFRSAKK